jgi:Tfp pilus assembly protein PilP
VPKSHAGSSSASAADDTTTTLSDDLNATPYVYSPVGKRDPFKDPNQLKRGEVAAGTGPLQKYDLDQLRLAFTTTATSAPLALIVDPSNQGHIVQIGDFVGKNWGKVSAIKREEVTVMETIADPNTGRVYPDYIPLRMPKSDAELAAQQFSLRPSEESGNP